MDKVPVTVTCAMAMPDAASAAIAMIVFFIIILQAIENTLEPSHFAQLSTSVLI
jgi:hypothetical protein